jgi:hypothetical protein
MKKMNKNYEAPLAEMIEMQIPSVLMMSGIGSGTSDTPVGGNTGNLDD